MPAEHFLADTRSNGIDMNHVNLKEHFPVIDALQSSNWNREIFEMLVDGGLDAVHVTLAYWEDYAETMQVIEQWNHWFKTYDHLILPVLSVADIVLAHKTGRTGIVLGFQNSSPVEDDLANVEVLHNNGIRIIQLTYNNTNLIGAGCFETVDDGLTMFGCEVISEMNRLGIIVDLSHTSERTSRDAIEYSTRPVAITHANPLFFRDVERNKSTGLLLDLAAGSGIGSDLCLDWDNVQLEYMRTGIRPESAADVAPEIFWPEYPTWFRKPRDLANVAQGMIEIGFSEEDTAKLMGGNWYRFLQDGLTPQ